jgi:hypothetical protein
MGLGSFGARGVEFGRYQIDAFVASDDIYQKSQKLEVI